MVKPVTQTTLDTRHRAKTEKNPKLKNE